MAGTKAGAAKLAVYFKTKYGEDYYQKIGAKGGTKSRNSWLKDNPGMASKIGKIGGSKSKRKPRVQA